ncbi:uncharacterized protein DS421_16g537340 [Arachis hypogaea]|nr:uncharacterized protein DS421_16g537340 [Arachis hypogaea]
MIRRSNSTLFICSIIIFRSLCIVSVSTLVNFPFKTPHTLHTSEPFLEHSSTPTDSSLVLSIH